MSESEYEAEQENSDQEFDVDEVPRQKLRPSNRHMYSSSMPIFLLKPSRGRVLTSNSGSLPCLQLDATLNGPFFSQNPKYLRNYLNIYRESKPAPERRQTRGKNNHLSSQMINLHLEDQQEHHNQLEEEPSNFEDDPAREDDDQFSIFNVEIGQFLWSRENSEGVYEYLVKYKNRSYLHTEWLTEQEMESSGKNVKGKLNRFNKVFAQRMAEGTYDQEAIEEGKYFEQSYLQVDRILTSTEMFPIIHQKKANEIKGKWSESIMLVCSKLLNFTKNNIHYGVLFCEPVDPQRDNCPEYLNIIEEPMDLGTILNKIYLDLYRCAAEFWQDVGLVWKNCLKFNQEPTSDLHILGVTLRECTLFLYGQWHYLCQQRYLQVKAQFEESRSKAEQKVPGQEELQGREAEQPHIAMNNNSNVITANYRNGEVNDEGNAEVNGQADQQVKMYSPDTDKLNPSEEHAPTHKQEQENLCDKSVSPRKPIVNEDEQFEDEQSRSQIADNGQPNANDLDSNSLQDPPSQIGEQAMEDERDYLNMEQFNNKNILLTEKKVEMPVSQEQLELLNPGEISYAWLSLQGKEEDFHSHNYEHIDMSDMRQLDLNVEVNRLYMIKWKNLSYSEATWELESVVSCPQKINEFKHMNKALGKESRTMMDQQKEKHRILAQIELNPKKRNKYSLLQLNEIKNRLYFYDVCLRKQPYQYRPQNAPIYKNYKMLRSYQLESMNWLIKSWYEKRNTILADQMGLGKTIQSIAFLYHLYTVENVKGPFLIIAPLSTLEHWKRTVEEWTTMNCVLYYDQNGSPGRRSIQYYEWYHINITMRGISVTSELNKFQVLITSYEVFLLDFNEIIFNLPLQFIVVDEAHRLKNKNAKILSALKRLPCKRVLLLTGTPIQNNTGELWSLLNYIHPQKFGSYDQFRRAFGDLSSNEQVDKLNKILKPYMLRRMKEDVEQSIPPLQETIIDVEMTNVQKTIYKALYEKNKEMLIKGLSSTTSCNANLNNLEIQLRKCCNHPFLIKELEYDLLKNCGTGQQKIDKLLTSSGKMVLVQKLLEKCKNEGKKVLIFSQFTHMLHLIEEYLRWADYKYERIDGQIKAKERQAAIDRYNNPAKKRDVFLLSTKAGGVGINLTSANVVIIYDSDWNPQNDVQATARAHRIGQKFQVQVYRLITCNTYETEMFERATQKLGLDKAIFIGGNFKEAGENTGTENKLSKNEMETLLKRGILGFLQNKSEEHNAEDFFQQNVDDIIQNNSRIAKYSLINGSCSFSKSRFVSEDSDKQLKINDPNFWNIVLKNVQSQTQILLKKIKSDEVDRSLQGQRQLMLEISEEMNIFIENKLSRNNLNTDDDVNLSELLTLINSDRNFNKFYRDLAIAWRQEIYKPSRRFRKLTAEDLVVPVKGGLPVKKTVNLRSNEQDSNNIYADDNEDDDENGSEQKAKLDNCKKEELLKRLCAICDKPKCTYYCQSYCKRSFHQECLRRMEEEGLVNFDAQGGKQQANQLTYDVQALKDLISTTYICTDCSSNLVSCLICSKKGLYYGAEYKKSKKNKGKKDEEVEEVVSSRHKRRNEVTKCSTANCAKYFHPKCIEGFDVRKLFKFIDTSSLHFRCSLHYCYQCGISGDTMSIFQCVRCPKALHTRCMDKDKVVKLSKKLFICDSHFKTKKELKKIMQRFVTPTLKQFLKAEKVEAKKLQEESEHEPVKPEPVENQVAHGYSTRRNRHTAEQIVNNFEEIRRVKTPPATKPPSLTYADLGIVPIKQFDYKSYDKDWCHYCGSRYSSNFTQGPWGSKTLCTVHYISWKQTKNLNLSEYTELPATPIDPNNDQQLKFLSSFAQKNPDIALQDIIPYLENRRNNKK